MKVYHGTSIAYISSIVQADALLSPLEQEIRELKKMHPPSLQRTELNAIAERLTRSAFGREYEKRGTTVSVTTELARAVGYATQYERSKGITAGIVLGFEFPDTTSISILPNSASFIFYVPEKIPLEYLSELHMTRKAHDIYWDVIHRLFAAHEPTYYLLR